MVERLGSIGIVAACIIMLILLCSSGINTVSAAAPMGDTHLTGRTAIPGGWIYTLGTDNDAFIVKAIITLTSSKFDFPGRIWLVGLSTTEYAPPTALALAAVSEGGWFGFPQLRLESSVGLLPQALVSGRDESGPFGDTDYITLGPWSPEAHTYEVTLSYNRHRGEVSFSLVDLTEQKEECSGFFYTTSFPSPLYAGLGVVGEGGEGDPKLTVQSFSVSRGYERRGNALVLEDGIEFKPIFSDHTGGPGYRSYSYWNEDLIFQVGKPKGQLPGSFRCTAVGSDGLSRELFTVPVELLPLDLNLGSKVLPPGKYAIILHYREEPGYEEEVSRITWEVVAPSATARINMPVVNIPLLAGNSVGTIKGSISIMSNQPIPAVRVKLVAKSNKGVITIIDKDMDELPHGETILPFDYEYELIGGVMAPTRFVLSLSSKCPEMAPFITEKDWPFTVKFEGAKVTLSDEVEVTIICDSMVHKPEEVDIEVVFASPSGKITSINGFYHPIFEHWDVDRREASVELPRAGWTTRFTPDEIGEWHYGVYVRGYRFGIEDTLLVDGKFLVLEPTQKAERVMAMEFYVSPQGDDRWSGRIAEPNEESTDGPFRTIERARDMIRELKARGELNGPVTVYLREGTYFLDKTIVFTPEDSGTREAPITYAAFPGEKPVISGGRQITASWKTDDGRIYYADIPEARDGAWRFRSLFVNERRETRARYPNYMPDDPEGQSYLYVGGQRPNQILAGLARDGDFVEYAFDIPQTEIYTLWIGVATVHEGNEKVLKLTIDGEPIPLSEITPSGDWRTVRYSRAAKVHLTAGRHTIRVENTRTHNEQRIHLDAFVFTDKPDLVPQGAVFPKAAPGEHRIVIQAEDDSIRIGGKSSITFMKFPVGASIEPNNFTIHADPDKIKASWAKDPEALVDIVAGYHYFNELVYIDSIDEEMGIIRVKGVECQEQIKPGNYFFISGVLEELDTPGEWYLDSRSGRLYYWPREGEDPNESVIMAPRLERLVEFQGDAEGTERVRWICIQGLTFKYCADTLDHVAMRTPTDAAIRLDCAWNCTIEDCHFSNIDGYGIWLHLDSCENVISGNTIENMGVGGVLLTSARLAYGNVYDSRPAVANYAPLRNILVRNHIHHGGQIRVCAAGFLLDSRPESTALEPGNLIAFNHVHHMTRQGVFGFGNQGGNIVAYNYFHHLVLETADAGAINFATMNNITAPTLIKNNVIHDVVGLMRTGEGEPGFFGGFGIYPDWSTSHLRVENNLVFNTNHACYLANAGEFQLITNNVFVDDPKHLLWISDNSGTMKEIAILHNILANTGEDAEKPVFLSSWRLSIDLQRELFRENPQRFLCSDYNLFWNAGHPVEIHPIGGIGEWQAIGLDENSIVADPLFTDPGNDDFSLQPESPAYRIGFKPIAITNIGVDARTTETLDIRQMAVAYDIVDREEAIEVGEHHIKFIPKINISGSYMVYVKVNPATAAVGLSKLKVIVHHDKGISESTLDHWVTPGWPPDTYARWGICIGTYTFRAGAENSIIFESDATATRDLPAQLILVERKW